MPLFGKQGLIKIVHLMKIQNSIRHIGSAALLAAGFSFFAFQPLHAQNKVNPATGSKQAAPAPKGLAKVVPALAKEDDYYKLITLPVPDDVILEVGGMATLPDGSLAVCTRRGEVWIVSNPAISGTARPEYRRFAHGLHEALG